MTANCFSTCETENRERIQENGKESEKKKSVNWYFSCCSQGCRRTQNTVRPCRAGTGRITQWAKLSVMQWQSTSHLLTVPWELPPGLRAWCQQCPKSLGAPEAPSGCLHSPPACPVEQEYGYEEFAMAVLHLAPVGWLGLSNYTL